MVCRRIQWVISPYKIEGQAKPKDATPTYKSPYKLLMKQVKFVQRTPDELDLAVLLANALHFFRYYGKLIAGVALIGLLAGLLRFWCVPNIYSSTLVLQPSLLTDPEQMEPINNWSAMLKKKELNALAHEFKVDKKLLKKIVSIKTEELQKSYAPGNYTAFTVTVLVTDTSILQPLQKGLLYALDNSGFIKEKLAYRKYTLQSLIQTTQQEIDRLYAWQSTIMNSMQAGNDHSGHIIVDVSGISGQIAALQEKKLSFEDNLLFTSAVHVLQPFYSPSRPEFPKLIKLMLLGLAGGLLLGGAIAFYLYLRKSIRYKHAD